MKEIQISVFKDLFKSTDVPYIVTLEKVIERIRRGTSKNLVDQIRKGNKELKKRLPSILFGGEFKERNSNGLVKHSGLMVLDFDKFPDTETMTKYLKKLKRNKNFVCLFISPSGNGIKGVIRVPHLDKTSHPKYFKAFQRHYNYDYFDMANSNVDRVCFESYDPNIYVNYDAEIFEGEIIDEGYTNREKPPVLPIDDEFDIIDKILNWDWKKDFNEGERNAYIFDLAGAFCEYGISQATAIGWINNNVVIGDFSEKEMETTIKSAYRRRDFDSKYFENYQKIERVKSDLKNKKEDVIKRHGINEVTYDAIKEEEEHGDFWYFVKGKVKIKNMKYKKFLERNGFKKYFPHSAKTPTWVNVKENKVKETSVEKIKDFVLKYLEDRNEADAWEYCSNYSNLFSEQFLGMLDSIELLMLKDQKDKSFIAYQNGILEITKNNSKLIGFIDVDGYVWESQIIQRDFKEMDDYNNDYSKFIYNIADKKPLAIECVIGYLLSTYKNKMNNRAIILNDEVISENPEGGTGKGLFIQGLQQIRKVSILDGKSFDDKKSFPYQTVKEDTQILVFDDVKKNFHFENKFSLVTEGMTLERKNKDAIKLSVEESPKIVISTNYAIKGEGNSHNRRRHEIEIAQYYKEDELTPADEFGRQLFADWNKDDYLKFDNYMVYCLQCYLKEGLIKQTAKNLVKRKFIAETSMEFHEWVTDRDNIGLNERLEKQLYFNSFTTEYKDYQKWLTRKRFNIWIQKYCHLISANFEEGNTNGQRWFMIRKTEEIINAEKVPF